MRKCPVCRSIYTDDSLQFCLQDGNPLATVKSADPEATLIDRTLDLPAGWQPTTERIVARPTDGPNVAPPATRTSRALVAVSVLSLLGLLGTAAYFLFYAKPGPAAPVALVTPTPAVEPAATPGKSPAPPKSAPPPKPTPRRRAAGEVDFTVTASSTRADYEGISYQADNLRDGDWSTGWIEGGTGPGLGESLKCDFGRVVNLQQLTITPGYFKSENIWVKNNRLKTVTVQFSDGSARQFSFDDEMRYVTLEVGPVKTRWVRLVIDEIYPGATDFNDTAISDISFTTAK
jgi:hypothetical protein